MTGLNGDSYLRSDPERELDHLEEWLPYLQWEPPLLLESIWTVEDGTSSGRNGKARRKPLRLNGDGDVIRCGTRHRSDTGLYAKLLETRMPELSRALEALRRLETLLAGDESQRRAALVLVVAYLATGVQVREEWRQLGGLGLWVAYVCADEGTRRGWILTPSESLGRRLALRYGDALLADARAAWYALPPDAGRPVHGRGRLRLAEIRDHVSRHTCAAWRDVRATRQARRQWRADRRKSAQTYGTRDT